MSNLIPKNESGQCVALPWIEWFKFATSIEFKRIEDESVGKTPKWARNQFSGLFVGQAGMVDWISQPFDPEKDLSPPYEVFGPAEKINGYDGEKGHRIKVGGEWFEVFWGSEKNDTTMWYAGKYQCAVKDDSLKTRSQFIELFHLATGEGLPLTEDGIKNITGG